MELSLEKIRTDGGTQPRAQIDAVTVSEYAEAMRRGDEFPPVSVMHDGEEYWLYDGFHRVQAARQIGREEIGANVEQGTKQDAQWASLAANKRHGLRRAQKDKERAIKRALKHTHGAECSDNQIANHVGVDNETVAKYRRELESTCEIRKSEKRTGADGRTIDTSNIGGSSGEDDPKSGVGQKLRSGEEFYCTYCYETHSEWRKGGPEYSHTEENVWECKFCDHATAEPYMKPSAPRQEGSEIQPGGDVSATSPESDLETRAERGAEKADAAGKSPEDATSDLLDKAASGDGGTPTPKRQKKREQRKGEYRERKQIEPFPEEGEYGVIYADPPWQYNNSGLDEYGHAERHYDTMGIDDLCELPVSRIAGEDCALYLWTTSPMLEDAFYVLSSWGFDYKTSYVWDKIAHNHGHYNSVRHELLLVATQGDGTPDRQKLYDSVVSIRRGDHSEKPPYFRRLLDVLYEERNKIELFAREEPDADRWDAWGDEV